MSTMSGRLVAAVSLAILAFAPARAADPEPAKGLQDLPLEDLLSLEVTTVSKQQQSVAESAAAVYVVTQDDIRRSGATTLPDLLRMVPGLQVGRITANTWSITARGFSGEFANKLLVLIDGRSVYSPLFSGVFWDTQDLVLEDIDRIEVIRGPGGSVWGANAVNAVVNVITKSAGDTRGGMLATVAGTEDREIASLRYGGRRGEDLSYRIYAKSFDRGPSQLPQGGEDSDSWDARRAGFRVDRRLDGGGRLTVQGDGYEGDSGHLDRETLLTPPFASTVAVSEAVSGGNLLARWTQPTSSTSSYTLQGYVDHTYRNVPITQRVTTYDLDLQHQAEVGAHHDLIWGAGYRVFADREINNFEDTLTPSERRSQLFSAFLEDLFRPGSGHWSLTFGTKVEHNDFTGFEVQPTVRALRRLGGSASVWAAVSRAVRSPSRADESVRFNQSAFPTGGPPGLVSVFGSDTIRSEDLTAYEAGYRVQATPAVSVDAAAFFNDYRHLRTVENGTPFLEIAPAPPHLVFPQTLAGEEDGRSHGLEVAANWRVNDHFKVNAWYAFFVLQLAPYPGSSATTLGEGESPRHSAQVRASWELPREFSFQAALFYVDRLPADDVPRYTRGDFRLTWKPRPRLEVSAGIQNAFRARHFEARPVDQIFPSNQVERTYDARLAWTF